MGVCKWCGAPASGPSPSRAVWAVAAVAALAVGVLFGWWVWRTRTPTTADVIGVPVRLALPSPSEPPTLDSSSSEDARLIALPPDDVTLIVPPTSPALAAPPPSGVVRWRAAVANAYANLRADARFDARIVGVLSPNQRLQVGEVVKGWRRVKTGAAEGWVDAKFLTVR